MDVKKLIEEVLLDLGNNKTLTVSRAVLLTCS